MNLKERLKIIDNCVSSALLAIKTVQISIKDEDDLVTSTDLLIERRLIETIKQHFAGDFILSEELHNHKNLKDKTWIIDPIDGTSNYAAGLSNFCIQVAYYDQGELVMSYINVPAHQKIYTAIKGNGAYLNDVRIYAHKGRFLSNQLISFIGCFRKNKPVPATLIQHAVNLNMKIRVLGSVGVEMGLLAEGVYAGLISSIKNIYDIAPGLLLAKEAGCYLVNARDFIIGESDTHLFGNVKLAQAFEEKT